MVLSCGIGIKKVLLSSGRELLFRSSEPKTSSPSSALFFGGIHNGVVFGRILPIGTKVVDWQPCSLKRIGRTYRFVVCELWSVPPGVVCVPASLQYIILTAGLLPCGVGVEVGLDRLLPCGVVVEDGLVWQLPRGVVVWVGWVNCCF